MERKQKSRTKGVKRRYYPFDHPDRVAVKGNKCVVLNTFGGDFKFKDDYPTIIMGFLCGYVALPLEGIPDGLLYQDVDSYLNFISVPGGITYAEPATESKEFKEIARDSYQKKIDGLKVERKTMKDLTVYMEKKIAYRRQYQKDLIDLGADTMVYGFDLGHVGHDDIKEYQDVKFVMKLCNQMEGQLLELIKRYPELEASKGERRAGIIEEIRTKGDLLTDISPISLVFGNSKFIDDE